ncbi:hypothetical protein [Rhodoblastus sp.]|uniref:hypothetical protein n=1 Tax=Rhodoblastus sp. TaxID=1962975 RepID=UPI003F9CD227
MAILRQPFRRGKAHSRKYFTNATLIHVEGGGYLALRFANRSTAPDLDCVAQREVSRNAVRPDDFRAHGVAPLVFDT